METFLFAYISSFEGTVSYRFRQIQFGDGYNQRSADGINPKSEEYEITVDGMTLAQKNDLDAFIGRHGGHKAFLWTPGGESQGQFVFGQPMKCGLRRGGGILPYWYMRQLTMRRA